MVEYISDNPQFIVRGFVRSGISLALDGISIERNPEEDTSDDDYEEEDDEENDEEDTGNEEESGDEEETSDQEQISDYEEKINNEDTYDQSDNEVEITGSTYNQCDQVNDSIENYLLETIAISSTDEDSHFKDGLEDGQQFFHVNKLFCASL